MIEDACLRHLLQTDPDSRVAICKNLLHAAETAAKEHTSKADETDSRQMGLFDTDFVPADPDELEYPPLVRKAFYDNKERAEEFHADLFKQLKSVEKDLSDELTITCANQIFVDLWQQYCLAGHIPLYAEIPGFRFCLNKRDKTIEFYWL